MNSAEELGSVDMIVHRMTTSSILSPESLVAGRGGSGAPGSAELGRRLLLAARHGDTQLVLDLMGRGAPFTTDWLGTSALHVAAGGAHTATCAVLLRAGVSRDARSKVDRTPLHMAAHAGHTEVAELLLLNHAAVDCRDMLSMTPLHWAAERGHMQIAGVLLKHGADPFAVSKFNKTPHSIAMERKRHDILKLIEDTLKEREAAKSVESLRLANETEANETQRSLDSLDRLAEAAKQTNKVTPPTEPLNINIERPLETSTEDASAAAAMLRRHGITLLPQDEGSTVLTALQSGRSVVLSDAGKLMLKESSEVPQVVKSPASKGVVLTATPVKSPPRQGVKIFTLNNKLLTMPKENKAPIKKVINPRDSMQLQYIKLPSDAKITTTKPVPMKAKNKLATAPARPPVQVLPAGAPGTVVPAGGSMRPTVKLMMQKANLNKLTENGVESAGRGRGRDERNVLFVPEEFLTNSSPKYLRAQLLSAHTTIAALSNQLETCRARLAHYEDV